MTEEECAPAPSDGPIAAEVVDEVATVGVNEVTRFLEDNPDFFSVHPGVLEHLSVPHDVGGAVSMVGYQVKVLRESNEELRQRLKRLVRNARENEDIGRRVHRLCLGLVQCHRLDEVLSCLHAGFAEDFRADLSTVRLFAPPADEADARLGEFVPAGAGIRERFDGILASGKPRCGRIEAELLTSLFEEQAGEIGSAALIPLAVSRPFGLLALCSREPGRFKPGSGTVFLQQIGDIVSHAMLPFLAER